MACGLILEPPEGAPTPHPNVWKPEVVTAEAKLLTGAKQRYLLDFRFGTVAVLLWSTPFLEKSLPTPSEILHILEYYGAMRLINLSLVAVNHNLFASKHCVLGCHSDGCPMKLAHVRNVVQARF